MRTRITNRAQRAFTLIEILIVVVILGILAAIVIPQFTDASTDASTSSVRSQLQTIRSQIELFRVQNNGTLPNMANFNDLVNGDYLQQAPINPFTDAAIPRTASPPRLRLPMRPTAGTGTVPTSGPVTRTTKKATPPLRSTGASDSLESACKSFATPAHLAPAFFVLPGAHLARNGR